MSEPYEVVADICYARGNPFDVVIRAAVIAELTSIRAAADADAEHGVVMQDVGFEWDASTWYDVISDRIDELKEAQGDE